MNSSRPHSDEAGANSPRGAVEPYAQDQQPGRTLAEIRQAAQEKIDAALKSERIDWREAYELQRIVESELRSPSLPKPTFGDLVNEIVRNVNQRDPQVVLTISADTSRCLTTEESK